MPIPGEILPSQKKEPKENKIPKDGRKIIGVFHKPRAKFIGSKQIRQIEREGRGQAPYCQQKNQIW